ncbi:unnamed protein product [Effrenium voratum]|uniref:Uncharacterized protein n=1 Tax=Effrenium voratum TaxID=2562239 RepID=A0AA36IZ99_9DINO|nr:unnamed protein product [Effrenium voratum]
MGGTLGASVAEEVVDVAIIGNGPSGLALAAALSGLVPEVLRNPPLSRDPAVNAAARRLAGRALDEAALFGEDIQRRCVNPSAALVDALRFPGGDGVGDSLLRYGQLKPLLRHAVVGRGPPGGSWQSMSPSTVTLSPGSWMDLPGHSLDEHLRTNASDEAKKLLRYYGSAQALSNARVPRWLVAEYYGSYARNLSATAFHSGTVEAMEEEGDCWRLQISGEEGCYALKAGIEVLELDGDRFPDGQATSVIKRLIHQERQISIFRQQLLVGETFISDASSWVMLAEQELQVVFTDYVEDYSAAFLAAAADGNADVLAECLTACQDPDVTDEQAQTACWKACEAEHLEVLLLLRDACADVEKPDAFGRRPLHAAARRNRAEAAQRLLETRADVNPMSHDELTPLHLAAQLGCDEVLGCLLDAAADANLAGKDGATGLFCAASCGHLRCLAQLLSARADVNAATENGETPLFAAAQHGYLSVVSCLLSASADSDRAANDGLTPLLMAAQSSQWRIFRFLVQAGANLSLAALDGATPLSIATLNGCLEDVKLLLAWRAEVDSCARGSQPLFTAAKHGQPELVRALLGARAAVDKPERGATPLFVAAKYDRLASAQLLIEAGADKDKADSHGATPLFIAAKYGQADMVRFLIEARADMDAVGQNGLTPLLMAVHMGRQDTVEVLCALKAEVNKPGPHGETPLLKAAQEGDLGLCQLLVQAAADLNCPAQDGATPLVVAAQSGQLPVLRYLADANAELDKVGQHGATALFIAALRNHAPMAELLIERRAQLEKPGADGATPLRVAAQHGSLDAARSLVAASAEVCDEVATLLREAEARAVALACGSFATPRRLEIFGEELPFVTHRPPIHTPALMEKIGHLLVVGAGLSAADAILHVLTGPGAAAGAAGRKVQVTHVFRGAAQQTKIGKMFGGSTSSTYRDEEWLARLMARKDSDPRYRPLAEAQLLEITEEGTCKLQTPTGEETVAEVSVVALLLGALPDLGFLPRRLRRALKAAPHAAVTRTDGQISSHPQFLEVNQETLQLADADTKEVLAPNVFAAGPLRGDNFVRFLIGDAFVIRQQVAASAKLARESA